MPKTPRPPTWDATVRYTHRNTGREEDGAPAVTHRDVRDHVITLLLAGHETTALALTWAVRSLARPPCARSRLESELDDVLGGRSPTPDALPSLPYTEAVLNETFRLRPPAYSTGREAVRDTSIDGIDVPKGHSVFVPAGTPPVRGRSAGHGGSWTGHARAALAVPCGPRRSRHATS